MESPSCSIIVVDNFYRNAIETRNYILEQEFSVKGNYPGNRTTSYATEHLKEVIQNYVLPFGGLITDFPIPYEDTNKNIEMYNGSFQYTTSRDRSWVHVDGHNNWGGVVFMTPDAPLSAGTGFYTFHEKNPSKEDLDKYSQDITKWKLVDNVGNVFNRLVLFNSKRHHMSMDYFGTDKESGRLFQVFFFSTER